MRRHGLSKGALTCRACPVAGHGVDGRTRVFPVSSQSQDRQILLISRLFKPCRFLDAGESLGSQVVTRSGGMETLNSLPG